MSHDAYLHAPPGADGREAAPRHAAEQRPEAPGAPRSGDANAAEGPPAIRVRHLWHRYGSRDVLKDVSFEVGQGEIFGFIGPNGAGKTTTINIMATLLEPMAGRVEIDGMDVALDPDAVRRLIGYMPDHAGVYDRISVREYLEFFADAFRVENLAVVDAVIELTDLGNLQQRLVAALSKGMKQRLQLARILLHDPKVLILDEPASDLDPRARIEIRDLLLELKDLGKTVFLSSHILTELSDICTSIGILEKGQLVVAGPIGEIGARLEAAAYGHSVGSAAGPQPSEATAPLITARRLKLRVMGDANQVARLLYGAGGVLGMEAGTSGQLIISHSGGDRFVADVVHYLVSQGVLIVGVEPERNELERIFLEYTRGDLQ